MLKHGMCRSCKAPILWALTERGKRIPLDVDPADIGRALRANNGNLMTAKGGGRDELDVVRVVKPAIGHMRSHFASCPNRRQHRKVAKR